MKIDDDALALSFLTWLDTLERLDTLLLEARHLQKNTLYFLREPTLYFPLDYEEKYIWLSDKEILEKLYKVELVKAETESKDIADKFIIPYPGFNPQTEQKQKDEEKHIRTYR